MCKCGKNKCGGKCSSSGASGDLASLSAQVADLQDTIDEVVAGAKFLLCGHPIVMIENQDDIDCFNLETGVGSECWEGWAACIGLAHWNPKLKKNITTPNLVDKFVVMASGEYEVGDTGGAKEVTLTTNQIPAHNHGVTDPGHSHDITDPGHLHAVDDDGHTHAFTGASHTHTGTTSNTGGHEHSPGTGVSIDDVGTEINVRQEDAGGSSTSTNGAHEHTFTTDAATAGGTVTSANTGVEVEAAFTGIGETESEDTGISIQNTGGGLAHENRPPYYSLLFVMKIY